MRYFTILVVAGRLHQPAVVEAGAWDPRRVDYQEEPVVDALLTMMVTDRKVQTLEQIDAEVERSKHHPPSRTLWIPETLEGEVRRRVERAAELQKCGNLCS